MKPTLMVSLVSAGSPEAVDPAASDSVVAGAVVAGAAVSVTVSSGVSTPAGVAQPTRPITMVETNNMISNFFMSFPSIFFLTDFP
jgi:hypothetical protein